MNQSPNEKFDAGLEDLLLGEEDTPQSSFDMGRILRALLTYKWLIIISTLVIFSFFYYRAKNQVPMYSTQAKIWMKTVDGQAASVPKEHVYELSSRKFSERVAAKFGLAFQLTGNYNQLATKDVFIECSTSNNPIPGEYQLNLLEDGSFILDHSISGVYTPIDSGHVFEILDTSKNIHGFTFKLNPKVNNPPVTIPFRIRTIESATNFLRYSVRINYSRGRDVMGISLAGTDPVKLANMVNYLSQIFVEETRAMRRRDSDVRVSVLEERVKIAERRYKESNDEFRKFQKRYPYVNENSIGINNELTRDIENKLEAFPEKRSRLESMLEQLGTDFGAQQREERGRFIIHQIATYDELATNIPLQITLKRLNDLTNQWNSTVVAAGYTEEHPQYQSLDKEIKEAYETIYTAALTYLNEKSSEEEALKERLYVMRNQSRSNTTLSDEFAELKRQMESDKQLHMSLLQDVEKMKFNQSVETLDIGILDEAPVPSMPTNMSKKIMIVLGGLLGFAFGSAIAITMELLDRRVKTPDDVKRYLKMQLLGTIPKVDFKDHKEYDDSERARHIDKLLVTYDYSPTPIGESYRSLRTNLLYSKRTGKINSICITSIAPDEGKSFTAANLAIIFAQQKSNTLLVDGDLRRGVLHNTFGCSKEPGLTNYLSGVSSISDILNETHIPNLTMVSCGALIPNPSELLGSLQMRRFLEEGRRRFDLIIIDSPPLSAATDAIVIGTQVDAVPIVLRAFKTNRANAKERLEMIRNVPVNIIGAILNGATSLKTKEAYSYYHY